MRDTRQQPAFKLGELTSAYTGKPFDQSMVDGYNGYTADFNRFTYTDEKEHMLDQRHKYFVLCCIELDPDCGAIGRSHGKPDEKMPLSIGGSPCDLTASTMRI